MSERFFEQVTCLNSIPGLTQFFLLNEIRDLSVSKKFRIVISSEGMPLAEFAAANEKSLFEMNEEIFPKGCLWHSSLRSSPKDASRK